MIKLTPPKLPFYLSGMYELMPIVGKPTEEQLMTIHAVMRTQNSISHVPTLSNPDLSMQLSQHLFDAKMAVHQFNYPVSELREIHVPPNLPPDIPEELHNVIGPPTDKQMKAVHRALRYVEDRSNVPELFDADLNMRLSQHLFDLQFARYIQYSAHPTSTDQSIRPSVGGRLNLGYPPEEETLPCAPKIGTSEGLQAGFERMEQAVKELHETMKGAKDILECVNRVLVSTQRSQTMVGSFDQKTKSTIHVNPVNKEGVLATDCGLPLLRYCLSGMDYVLWMDSSTLARYLIFFEIGLDLIRGENEPMLANGMEDEAAGLLFKHIGIHYNRAQYYKAHTN